MTVKELRAAAVLWRGGEGTAAAVGGDRWWTESKRAEVAGAVT
jgi:hypothetical protein